MFYLKKGGGERGISQKTTSKAESAEVAATLCRGGPTGSSPET